MRKEITEAQITELMQAIPRAEEVDRLRAENERLRENVDRAGKEAERADRLRAEIARVKADEKKNRAEIERLREVIRTIRARCVELDDSDAVSETLDIATAVLEDEP